MMNKVAKRWARLGCAVILAHAPLAQAQDDAGALLLQSAPEAEQKAADKGLRFFVEAAAGSLSQRFGLPTENASRLSLDLNWTVNSGTGWRAVLSNRLDDIHPAGEGSKATLNSLREAYVGHQDEAGQTVLEFGRINVRNGPGYGYNPSDFFRDGSLRAVTTADPLALRDNRMGTVMFLAQRLWTGGSAAVALAPKLATSPDTSSFGLDLGATNPRDRALVTLGAQASDKVSGQLLAYLAEGQSKQLGANMTALLSDTAVAHFEWAGGHDDGQDSPALGTVASGGWRNRGSTGLTYSGVPRLAVTAEVEYNGTAANGSTLNALSPDQLGAYLLDAQQRQDNAGRWEYLLYATQRGGFTKNLDITALLRVNARDNSRFGWVEARYHWPKIDLALQFQRSSGSATSEYGASSTRQLVQLLAAFYF